jgi:hypothetical protein
LLEVLDCWAPTYAIHRAATERLYKTFNQVFEIIQGRKTVKKYLPHGGAPVGDHKLVILDQEIPESLTKDIVEPNVTS